jgi:hypothetical protein
MAYERLIRKLLQLPKRPAVVLMQVTIVRWGCQPVDVGTASQTCLCTPAEHIASLIQHNPYPVSGLRQLLKGDVNACAAVC